MKNRRFTFLGTGTSQGVPVIGCPCAVCTSKNKKDKRLRTSAMVSYEVEKTVFDAAQNKDILIHHTNNIVIDCGPDFREQMLRAGVTHVEALLMTHEHADHIAGIEDLRPFQFRQGHPLPVYATPKVQEVLRKRYDYAFLETVYPGAVEIDLKTISKDNAFKIADLEIQPIEINHGSINVLGFRFDDFTYITDCKSIEYVEFKKIMDSRILVLDALHHTEHHSHMNLKQALDIVDMVKPEQAYFVHMSHNMGLHNVVNRSLPKGVSLAWDGLSFGF
jgi:phosphoribosyl 1,2-cyclic phosphate phosphodiesterase